MKQLTVNQEILFYSLKYALTRVGFAPTSVATDIIHNLKDIDIDYLYKFIAEIDKKYHPDESAQMWESLVKDINFELSIRNMR